MVQGIVASASTPEIVTPAMADNRDLINALMQGDPRTALRNPLMEAIKAQLEANPYAMPPEPLNRPTGGEIRNLPPRPNDALQAALAEQVSPTMGAYGAGSLAAQIGVDAKEGNWSGVADAAPLALGMVAGGKPKAPGRILYHGTEAPSIIKFDGSKKGETTWFANGVSMSPEKAIAERYGNPLEVRADLKKTYIWNADLPSSERVAEARKIFPDYVEHFGGRVHPALVGQWTDALKREGYDSLSVRRGGKETEIVALNPDSVSPVTP